MYDVKNLNKCQYPVDVDNNLTFVQKGLSPVDLCKLVQFDLNYFILVHKLLLSHDIIMPSFP
jgi:hypothetical protein